MSWIWGGTKKGFDYGMSPSRSPSPALISWRVVLDAVAAVARRCAPPQRSRCPCEDSGSGDDVVVCLSVQVLSYLRWEDPEVNLKGLNGSTVARLVSVLILAMITSHGTYPFEVIVEFQGSSELPL
jgi:hypothetical protein